VRPLRFYQKTVSKFGNGILPRCLSQSLRSNWVEIGEEYETSRRAKIAAFLQRSMIAVPSTGVALTRTILNERSFTGANAGAKDISVR
jgi:hypothetical protein